MCRCDKTAPAKLRWDEWLDIAKQAINLGAREIGFTGGEPTLLRGFDWILAGLREADPEGRVKLKLLTNGVRLSPSRARTYLALGIRRFIISLHGSTSEVHDKVVGVASQWARTTEGIRNLRAAHNEYPHTVWINCVVSRLNLHQLPQMVELATALGCEGISFSPLDRRVADAGVQPLMAFEMRDAVATIFPAIRRMADELGILLFPNDAQLFGRSEDEIRSTAHGELSRSYYRDHPCHWVFYHVTIEPDGTVQPCCNRPLDGGYGSLTQCSLDEVIRSDKARGFLRLAATGPHSVDVCRGCEMKLQVNQWVNDAMIGGSSWSN
jgi:MoaA/NifB/PqqE/SkfB family radical SAM enzyme